MTTPNRLYRWFTIRKIGASFLLVSFIIGIWGYISQHEGFSLVVFFEDYYANLSAELASIALTVLIVDAFNRREAAKREKEDLILQMGSPANRFTQEAIRKLEARGWLLDRSIQYANLRNADLKEADLWRADLQGVDFYGSRLMYANLQAADMKKANIRVSNARKSNLRGADLREADLTQSDFRLANLRGANLQNVTAQRVNFAGADLRETNMVGTNLRDANLSGANLQGARLREMMTVANIRLARNQRLEIQRADLEGARFDRRTVLPDGEFWTPDTDLTQFTSLPDDTI